MVNKIDDKKMIQLALQEDVGGGDITSRAVKLKGKKGKAIVVAKQSGVVSGIDTFTRVYKSLSPAVSFHIYKRNGSEVVPGNVIIKIKGPLDVILIGERTAMNFLSHLSGVATATREIVEAVKDFPVKILDTRKTHPGLRLLQKRAVRDGGGANHRIGLYDMYLIKENHIEAAGSLERALEMVIADKKKTNAKVEVEVKNFDELKRALKYKPDFILLDNFTIPMLRQAVKIAAMIDPRAILEASGNVSLKTVKKIAATGVHRISIGKITHSAPVLDLSLKVVDK
jgi:nicotinate-nucleotide pyrophosphorylase (carboxylating)